MNKRTILFVLTAAACILFIACQNEKIQSPKPLTEKDQFLLPGEYDMDFPTDIYAYFDTLYRECDAEITVHIDDYNDSAKIWDDIKALNDYANGHRKYYPIDEVRHTLDQLFFQVGYDYSHAVESDDIKNGISALEIFVFRFLEQAVRLSPQVDFVTDFHSADGEAGIIYYHEWSVNPLYSFLIYKTPEGLRVKTVGNIGTTQITKLFHLNDNEGRSYLLCSNNGKLEYSSEYYDENDQSHEYHEEWNEPYAFCQYLYLFDSEGNLNEVASTRIGYEGKNNPELDINYDAIVFNPQKLIWEFCIKDGDVFKKIEGTPALRLTLNGKNSSFSKWE